jgi:hypothetical protein
MWYLTSARINPRLGPFDWQTHSEHESLDEARLHTLALVSDLGGCEDTSFLYDFDDRSITLITNPRCGERHAVVLVGPLPRYYLCAEGEGH